MALKNRHKRHRRARHHQDQQREQIAQMSKLRAEVNSELARIQEEYCGNGGVLAERDDIRALLDSASVSALTDLLCERGTIDRVVFNSRRFETILKSLASKFPSKEREAEA